MHIKSLKSLNKNDVLSAGGKGAALGEMKQAQFLVPNGFVVLASAFDYFLEINKIEAEILDIINKVDHQRIKSLELATHKIQALISKNEIPKEIKAHILKEFSKLKSKLVAVRSSATAEDSVSLAWAGQLNSFLNSTEKNLLANVKNCWASLFTPRAMFYRIENKLHQQKISVAVVVQEMVKAEVSGVAFSVHPVTENYNHLIIEVGAGLGDALVSGQITPDAYVVDKKLRQIIETDINEQKLLSDKDILELAKIIIKIENHFGFPCDVEWAREDGKFHILQSRPITTL